MNPFIEGRNAGLSVIPVRKGSKVPAVAWKDFQTEICSELQAVEWGNGHGYGIGLVTGEVSGRLMALDFEVGFLEGHGLPELAKRLKIAEVYDVFWSWMQGYSESTPSGGLHILVRLEGEGRCPPNEVFARERSHKPLIETRGEGGYVLVAPTPGYQLASGGFSSITYCTLEEWAQMQAVLASFDASPAPPALTVPTRSTVRFEGILGDNGPGWIDEVKANLPSMSEVLQAHGWYPMGRRDQFGAHWVRPGKDPREGHSASISDADRLWVHSSNTNLPMGVSLDVVDVLWCWETGHEDRAPSLEERTVWLEAQRSPSPESAGASSGGGPEAAIPNLSTPVCIEDWFWEARPLFRQIRDSSMERGLSPDGVFGAWLSGYAATVPMGIWVAGPPTRAPLNIFSCLVGNPGTGKTSSMRIASDLLGWNVTTNPHVLLGRPLRSGEGLVKLAVIPPKRGDLDATPSYRNAVQVAFDEGGVLGKQTDRTGSSTIPFLNSAWSGDGTIGGALSKEVLEFPANLVRICVVMGVQYGAAANLFTGESLRLGFPQRFLYFGLKHPNQADADVDTQTSGPVQALDLPFWPHNEYSGQPIELGYPADIERQIRLWTRNKDHGDGLDDDYDAHQMNLTKRTGAIFTLSDGRGTPNDEDWALAQHVYDTSRKIRNQLRASLKGVDMERQRARITEAVNTADALDDRWIRRRASRIARHVHHQPNGCTLKDIKNRLASDEKRRVHEILAYATTSNWVIHKEDRYFPGGSQPAL